MPDRPLLLAAALADHRPSPDPAALTARARAAERAGLDLLVIEAGPFDPLLVAARLAAQTVRIGIAPVASTTATEPFHVSTALATIDVVGRGRAGWVLTVDDPAAVRGMVTWEVPGDAAGDAAEHLDAVRALWDSWEEGAVIRDVATDRFLDREKLHHVDLRGTHLAVRGPSITPRPPQGHPPVLVRVHDDATLALALRDADALMTRDPALARGSSGTGTTDAGSTADAAPSTDRARGPLRFLELDAAPGDAEALAGRIAEEHAAGVDGVVLHAEHLEDVLASLLPALAAAGVRPVADGPGPEPDPTGERPPLEVPRSLRETFGLPPAPNRFAEVAA